MPRRTVGRLFIGMGLALAVAVAAGYAAAQDGARPAPQASPLHPVFALLDADGQNVLDSAGPISPITTCGQCHDTAYIDQHSTHADAGLRQAAEAGQGAAVRAWDTGAGLFTGWNPLLYRYLSLPGDERLDLGTADWLRLYGVRHAGGGPAVFSRSGAPLDSLPPDAANPEAAVLDPLTGQPAGWDWQASGVAEQNCFLCHLANPDNHSRIASLADGAFGWASTATLANTGLVARAGDSWAWNRAAFAADGRTADNALAIQDPDNANCGLCHGVAQESVDAPLALASCDLDNPLTALTGQVIAASRISQSGMNLADKAGLTRAWDVHAARGLVCTDCHAAPNNPARLTTAGQSSLEHLTFDPRRLDTGEYLQRPNHDFSAGQGGALNCTDCHNPEPAHPTLPYLEAHLSVLACETCHTPKLYAPAVQVYDWTVLTADAEPARQCRGVDDGQGGLTALVTGFEPALLPRQNPDGSLQLAPYNLVTAWYWLYDDVHGNTRPVRQADLEAAWLDNGQHAPEILAAFDADGNGSLNSAELRLDTPEKQAVIARRLAGLGLAGARVAGETQAHAINHAVTRGEWVAGDCQACHADESRLAQPVQLASFLPGGVVPEALAGQALLTGADLAQVDGALVYQRRAGPTLYVFGATSLAWVDWLGALAFLGVVAGASAHAGARFVLALRRPRPAPALRREYMYGVYERLWHWLQSLTILLLIATGLIIHRPDIFAIFSFRHAVTVHNVLAAVLVINAALSLFYHLASGEIRQYIPRPYGFFDQAIVQARYYLHGIFRGAAHPFEKTAHRKLNPLQQVTYFGILNVLLPLQIITGALMWGAQRWPEAASLVGGLPLLGPLHSLVAWLFAAFIVMHVYLTTTGPTPLAGMDAMINGWDSVETHAASEEAQDNDPTDRQAGSANTVVDSSQDLAV